jgi:hypothetical protein
VIITKVKSRKAVESSAEFKHDRFAGKYTGSMTCILTALTPIHIGSGVYELAGDNPVRGLMTADGKAIVPGTSLKGAIRSIAEAISDSCMRITRLRVGEAPACNEVRSKHRGKNQEKGGETKLCPCCRIFGGLGYQGRVSFTDARLTLGVTTIHTIQSPYPPRESARAYKDAQGQFNGRKFYYHGEPVPSQRGEPYQVIAEKSELRCAMNFENLTAEEFCLVLVAMGILDDIIIKVGGGKQAMLGSIEIMPVRLELQTPAESFLDFSSGIKVVEEDIIKYLLDDVGGASGLINEDALNQLTKIWEYPSPSDRKAPTGMY